MDDVADDALQRKADIKAAIDLFKAMSATCCRC